MDVQIKKWPNPPPPPPPPGFTLHVDTGTTQFFALVSIISEKHCNSQSLLCVLIFKSILSALKPKFNTFHITNIFYFPATLVEFAICFFFFFLLSSIYINIFISWYAFLCIHCLTYVYLHLYFNFLYSENT